MAATTQKSALNVVMGAMTFGAPGTEGARVHDLKDVEAILDTFRTYGHTEVDSARTYSAGTSEEYLGEIDLESKGLRIETKLFPRKALIGSEIENITHNPEDIRKHLLRSLKALNVESLDLWYLHGPDRSVPYEVTLKAVNDLYKEGYFKRFGISNYAAWEVAEIVTICRHNGYIQPTVYQGIYNAIHRSVEPELLPALRKFGLSFYAYNPLAGGFFTGRYASVNDQVEVGSRFDPQKNQGQNYRTRYWNEHNFKILASIRAAAEKHSLSLVEIAFRWLLHHSELKREYGDSIIIGASNLSQLQQNLQDLEKGPLSEEVVHALDEAWFAAQPYARRYFR